MIHLKRSFLSVGRRPHVVFTLLALCQFLFSACQPSSSANTTRPCGVDGPGGDVFAIYTSTIEGKDLTCIVSDPERELNHVRVSPDGKMITFTRFNKKKLFSKLAEEDNGYTDTEIMTANIDGTDIKSRTRRGVFLINVNSYWTPDGKALVFMSNDNPNKKLLRIKRLDLQTGKMTDLSPAFLPWVSDPHLLGNRLVFPAAKNAEKTTVRAIWTVNIDTGEARQLSHPGPLRLDKGKPLPPPGDSDPKISPDGRRVAFTRHMGNGSFHTMVMDLASGREQDLSQPGAVDVMPEWSSDGRLLVYWHVDLKNLRKIGIYTITPDGKKRRQVPLPKGFHFKMPAFVPGSGSGPGARIVFTGKKVPQIR